MAESSWPTVAGSHAISDTQWELMAQGFAGDGVIGTPADTTVVYADSTGMQVKVRAGKFALLRGHGWQSGTPDFTKAISANASGSTRIDLVVLRFARADQTVTVQVKAGTPGSGVAPALQQDPSSGGSGLYEIALAQVTVITGASTIAAADVSQSAAYLAMPPLMYVPDITTLNRIPSPTNGRLAYVTSMAAGYPLYQYLSGWRRLDWAKAWGVIGGTRYPGSGFFAYAYATIGDTGIRTGNVSLLAGRRYTFELAGPVGSSATADVSSYLAVEVRKSGVSVAEGIAEDTKPASGTWMFQIGFEYAPSVDETVNFELWASANKTSGTTLNWSGFHRGSHTYFRVRDNGPATLIAIG